MVLIVEENTQKILDNPEHPAHADVKRVVEELRSMTPGELEKTVDPAGAASAAS